MPIDSKGSLSDIILSAYYYIVEKRAAHPDKEHEIPTCATLMVQVSQQDVI